MSHIRGMRCKINHKKRHNLPERPLTEGKNDLVFSPGLTKTLRKMYDDGDEMSISPTFYVRIFCTKVFSLLRVWLWMNFCTKNARIKCWWIWREDANAKKVTLDAMRSVAMCFDAQNFGKKRRLKSRSSRAKCNCIVFAFCFF